MPENYEEKNLTKDAQGGDMSAFEMLVFAYEAKIYRHVYNLTGQKQDAEDLTQETFVRFYKNLKKIDPDAGVKGWLYKTATNATYDWFRRKKAKPELLIINDPEADFETIDDDFSYIKIETRKDIDDALAKIKVAYRTVLSLFYFQGLKYEEIATILAIPVGTVKTHLRRAKRALKEALENKK